MKPTIFLRIAAVLTLIHSILHTIGGVFGKPLPGPAEQAVAAMKANHFMLMGSARTYWDFYIGFGLGITVFLTVEAIVFWLLGSLGGRGGPPATHPRRVRSRLSGLRPQLAPLLLPLPANLFDRSLNRRNRGWKRSWAGSRRNPTPRWPFATLWAAGKLGSWEALVRYGNDARLEMENNAAD